MTKKIKNLVEKAINSKSKNKKVKVKKTNEEIITEATNKNKKFLLDIERIVDDYFKTLKIYNPDKEKLNFNAGIIVLSIIHTANKIIEDKDFVEWCKKIIKEEAND